MPIIVRQNQTKLVIKVPMLPSGSINTSTLTADTVMIGDKARFRKLSNGVVFEVKDTGDVWQEVWRQTQ